MGERLIAHKECRMGEGAYHGDASTSSLQCYQSCFCRGSSLSVIVVTALWFVRSVLTLFLGRNRDYQSLNLTFAINVIKYGIIINMFPKPLKPYVVVPIYILLSLSLRHTLVSWHACYRISLHRFNKRLDLSDLWLRSGWRRRRNLERTGINRFVNQPYRVFIS